MSNLVRKQITDKNGVSSTRWVKPDMQTGADAAGLPSPKVQAATDEMKRDKLLTKAVERFVRETVIDSDWDAAERTDHAEYCFDQYSTQTLKEIGSSAASTPNMFVKMYALKYLMENGADESAVRDLMNSLDVLEEYGLDDPDEAVGLVLGLSQYPGIQKLEVDGEYPNRRKKQCASVLSMTLMTGLFAVEGKLPESTLEYVETGPKRTSQVLTNKRLAKLIVDRPEDIHAILDIIGERETDDVDHILEVLDSDTPALAEGIL